MKELSRRAMSTESNGMACGPMSVYAIDAEIVVEDEGKTVYLHTQWVDAVSEEILFEATTASIYDAEAAINAIDGTGADFDTAIENRDRLQAENALKDVDIYERYAKEYEQLIDLMQEVLKEDGIDFDLRNPYDDEDWDEEEEDEDEDEE